MLGVVALGEVVLLGVVVEVPVPTVPLAPVEGGQLAAVVDEPRVLLEDPAVPPTLALALPAGVVAEEPAPVLAPIEPLTPAEPEVVGQFALLPPTFGGVVEVEPMVPLVVPLVPVAPVVPVVPMVPVVPVVPLGEVVVVFWPAVPIEPPVVVAVPVVPV